MSIYLDESGDLGFDWKKTGTSNYFVVTLLVCENNKVVTAVKKAVKRTIKNKLNNKVSKRRIIYELKGTSTTFHVKKYFFSQLPQDGWSLYYVALNKKRVEDHLKTRLGKKKTL